MKKPYINKQNKILKIILIQYNKYQDLKPWTDSRRFLISRTTFDVGSRKFVVDMETSNILPVSLISDVILITKNIHFIFLMIYTLAYPVISFVITALLKSCLIRACSHFTKWNACFFLVLFIKVQLYMFGN